MSVPTTPSGGIPYSVLADCPHELGTAAADDERREPLAAECVEQFQHRLVHPRDEWSGERGVRRREHELLGTLRRILGRDTGEQIGQRQRDPGQPERSDRGIVASDQRGVLLALGERTVGGHGRGQ